MAEFRLKITDQDLEQLRNLVSATLPNEGGAFALAGIAEHRGRTDILVRRPIAIPSELFTVQNTYRLEIAPRAINGLVALCETNGLGAVLCHSHPDDIPYSSSDDYGEGRIFEVLRRFIPSRAPTASLLFTPNGWRGRVWIPGASHPVPLSEILIVGRYLQRIILDHSHPSRSIIVDPIFDRQVRAFGSAGQTLIEQAKIGIVGVGGTGSPTAEQLVRLGTRDLILVDPDEFNSTNLTRVYGSYASSGRGSRWPFRRRTPSKVEIVARHLRQINPEARIRAIPRNIVIDQATKALLDRDVLFLCTDDHWGRSIGNQITYQYFIPSINLGARISSENGVITAAVGTVDILRPDRPCLWCRGFLNGDRVRAESIPRSSRESLLEEGYIDELDINTPSVISLTTTVSGLAVSMYLQLLTDFMGPDTGDVRRLNYDPLEGTVRRGYMNSRAGCICLKSRAYGDLRSIPTLIDLDFLEA